MMFCFAAILKGRTLNGEALEACWMVLAAALPNIDMAIVLTVVWIDEIQRSCTPTPLCLWVTDTAPDTHHDSHL